MSILLIADMQHVMMRYMMLNPIRFQAKSAVRGQHHPDPFITQNQWVEQAYAGVVRDMCHRFMEDGRFNMVFARKFRQTPEGKSWLKEKMMEFRWLESKYHAMGLSALRAVRELMESLVVLITESPFSDRDLPFVSKNKKTGKRPSFSACLEQYRLRFENLSKFDAFDIHAYCERATSGKIGYSTYEVVPGSDRYCVSLRYYPVPKGYTENGKIVYMASPLINKPELFDMDEGKSVVAAMHEEGYAVYLIDPGNPGPGEADLGLSFYGKKIHDDYIGLIQKRHPRQELMVMGYCMGGTLVLAYLARRAEERMAQGLEMDIKKLALMAAPVKFDDSSSGHGQMRETIRRNYSSLLMRELFGDVNVPPQIIEFGMNEIQPGVRYNVKKGFYDRAVVPGAIEDSASFLFWLSHGTRFASRAHREWIERIFMGNEIFEGTYCLPSHIDALDQQPVRMSALTDAGVMIFDYRGDRDPISPTGSCVASETWGQQGEGNLVSTRGGLNRTIEKNVGHIFVVSKKLLAMYVAEVVSFFEDRPIPSAADSNK